MRNGLYKTEAGSFVKVDGKFGGIHTIDFDWLEEPNACVDCGNICVDHEGLLQWSCDKCGGGEAVLMFQSEEE